MSLLYGGAEGAAVQIMALSGNPRPQSRTHTLAVTLAGELARVIPDAAAAEIELADLGSRVLDQGDPAAAAAVTQVLAADILVIASPTYKASYSGLLKSFLDRFGTGSLAGKTAVPIMLGGLPGHQLAVNVHFTPLLLELGAKVPAGGLFVLESDVPDFATFAAAWAKENAAALTAI
jgi:FMN reductase